MVNIACVNIDLTMSIKKKVYRNGFLMKIINVIPEL